MAEKLRIILHNPDLNGIKQAVESQRAGSGTHVQSVPLKETFRGQTVREGVVEVFDLEGNAKSTCAYARSKGAAND